VLFDVDTERLARAEVAANSGSRLIPMSPTDVITKNGSVQLSPSRGYKYHSTWLFFVTSVTTIWPSLTIETIIVTSIAVVEIITVTW